MFSGRRRLVVGVLAVAVLLAAVAVSGTVREQVLGLAAWFRDAGSLGVVTYVALFTLSALAVLPASGFTLLAGFAYGLGHGFAVALPASTIAAGVNFWFARTLGRQRIEQALHPTSAWRAVMNAASTRGFGWVLLLRLSPVVPFSVLNYLVGASRMKFWSFIVASTLGKAPSAFAYVYLGSAARQLSTSTPAENVGTRVLFWVGLCATCVVVFQVGRLLRQRTRELLKAVDESNA